MTTTRLKKIILSLSDLSNELACEGAESLLLKIASERLEITKSLIKAKLNRDEEKQAA